MRGGAIAVVGAALLGALTACSPGHNATLAVGYDADGRLIAAAKVCHDSVAEAQLVEAGGTSYSTVGSWARSSPLEHMETWPLLGETDGPWSVQEREITDIERKAHYELSLWSSDHGWGNHLGFTGRDLAHLVPGEVLVERVRRVNPEDAVTWLEIITLEQLADETC
jgi:hypothetical protein